MSLSKAEIRRIIENEIIVDCYDDDEIYVGWGTYMDDNIFFPFEAEYNVRSRNGKNKWHLVRVIGAEESRSHYKSGDYYVNIEFQSMILSVKIDELREIQGSDETMNAIEVWRHRDEF